MRRTALLFSWWLVHGLAAASPVYEPGSCQQDRADTCIDTTPCKTFGDATVCLKTAPQPPKNSIILQETCWQYEAAFTCRDSTTVDTCGPLRARGCGQIGTKCLTYKPGTKQCTYTSLTYQCEVTPPSAREIIVCDTGLCQTDGMGCFDTSRPPDRDFAMAAVMMEAAREGGVYGLKGGEIEVFKGYMEECSIKTLGGSDIKSCCSAAGGGAGFSNYDVIGVPAKAAYAVGKEEMKAGSKYMYDSLFQSQDASMIAEGMDAAGLGLSEGAAQGVASQAGTSFGAYGFEFSYSASGGFSFVGFDPYSFAIAVVIAIITEWLECDQEEQVMQMKRGLNLCVYVGTYCSSSALSVCIEKREKHCCFNSILAKTINRQGREQLHLRMDICDGFTEPQLKRLDFARMDFTEFIASIDPTEPDKGATEGSVRDTVARKVRDYYGGD